MYIALTRTSLIYFFFFFSSRRRHTRFDCDWSSDVCSSDLGLERRRYHRPLSGDVQEILAGVRDPGGEHHDRHSVKQSVTILLFHRLPSLSKDESLERGRNADSERSVRRIRALIDTAELVPDVAGRPEGAPGRQGGIEPRVPGDREQVFRLHIDARGRDPPDPGRRQVIRDLQAAQPDVRAVLDPIARELPAERGIAVVQSGILGVRVRHLYSR